MLRTILNSRAFIWGLLALPSIPMVGALRYAEPDAGRSVAEMLLHPTGEFSARFLIIAMVLTPMRILFPVSTFWRWMKEDGGCWEVYGTTPEGQRVEGYFHPATGAAELIAQRGRILFRAD